MLVKKASPDVTIDNQTYSIQTIPADDSQIVQKRTQEVLKGIKLDKLVEGLDQCATFIYLAYLGTAGYSKIQSQLLILHDSFGKTCAETDMQLVNFSQQSANVQRKIKFAASCLLNRKVESACKMLSQCSGIAEDLSKCASSLAAGYENLNKQGLQILIATSEQKDLDEVERLRLEKLKKELEIQKQQEEDLRETLNQQTKTIEAQYNVTAAEASEARGRAFGLALTSTILGGVSAGISAGVSAFLPRAALRLHQASSLHIDIDTSSADIIQKAHEKEKLIKEVEKKMKEKREDLNKSDEEVQREEINLEKAKKEHEKLLSNSSSVVKEVLTTAEEKVNLLIEKLTDVKHKKDQVLKTFNELEEELKSIQTDHQKLKATLESLRDSTSKMSDNYEQLASNLTKEKQKYFDMLLQSQKEESQNLSNLRKVALSIEATQKDEWSVKSSIDCLYISIGALRKVNVILIEIKEFWDRMSKLCNNLANSQFTKELELVEDFDDQQYFSWLEVDLKPEFMKTFAGWKAVEVISNKYAYETSKVRNKVLHDFEENLTTEEARVKASAMAKRLISQVNSEIGENERDQLQTQAERAALKG